jgi:hypothetical protein
VTVARGLYGAVAEILATARNRYQQRDAREAIEVVEGELVAYFRRLHPAFDPEQFRRAAWPDQDRNDFAHQGRRQSDGPV